ncbi:MAG: chromate transporter [Clostridia bacterium]|jgi:chromate transporter|nr:chromate transporter [Clostridia bacterium]
MIYIRLFLTFLKIGFVGFGGGLAILPLIYQGVSRFTDITKEQFANFFGISQATPGPIAVNAATYVGFETAGVLGAACSTLGVILPSFLLVVVFTKILTENRDNRLVDGAFVGIRPVTLGMLLSGVWFIAEGALFVGTGHPDMLGVVGGVDLPVLGMALVSFGLSLWNKAGAITLIITMGVIGALVFS